MTDYLNPSRIYTDGRTAEESTEKKCGNPQLFSEAERLIGEINRKLDGIGIKGERDCTDTAFCPTCKSSSLSPTYLQPQRHFCKRYGHHVSWKGSCEEYEREADNG